MTRDTTVTVLRALGDEIRLGMVRAIARERRPVSSCDVVGSCSSLTRLSQPTISHHFHKLVEAGVLVEHKDGTTKQYQIDRHLLASVGIDLTKLLQ